jgi:hypothetical protein
MYASVLVGQSGTGDALTRRWYTPATGAGKSTLGPLTLAIVTPSWSTDHEKLGTPRPPVRVAVAWTWSVGLATGSGLGKKST